RSFAGGRSQPRFSSSVPTRYMGATGARRRSFTACTSRPATTRASNTASSTACAASNRALRASTRSRGGSRPLRRGRRIGFKSLVSKGQFRFIYVRNRLRWIGISQRSRRTYRFAAMPQPTWRETHDERFDRLVVRARCPAGIPARGARAQRARRAAGRWRRPVSAAAARSLPAGDLPLVFARPADLVVVSRSARRASTGPPQGIAKPGKKPAQPRLRNPNRYRVSRSTALLRQYRAAAERHLVVAGDASGLSTSTQTRLCAFRRDVARRSAGRRPLRDRARECLFRRVDVQPRTRCLEGRTQAAVRRTGAA